MSLAPFGFSSDASGEPVGRRRRWLVLNLGVLAFGILALSPWGGFLLDLFKDYGPKGPLELPAELVVARGPGAVDWYPDPARGGFVLVSCSDPSGYLGPATAQRWLPPWRELVTAPDLKPRVPAGWHSADGQLHAFRQERPEGGSAGVRIVKIAKGEGVARYLPCPISPYRKSATWHPTSHVFVTGGYGQVDLAAEPDWHLRTLATAPRDRMEWERRVRQGQEETGYHPSENVTEIRFSSDGSLLVCAMDRGLRVYAWDEVLRAADRLPEPKFAVDSVLVKLGITTMAMTKTALHDASGRRLLWCGLDGVLYALDTETRTQRTLLRLTPGYIIERMELLEKDGVLCCEIVRMGRSTWTVEGLFLLDYPKLLGRGKAAP
jgi:hypothetical protein